MTPCKCSFFAVFLDVSHLESKGWTFKYLNVTQDKVLVNQLLFFKINPRGPDRRSGVCSYVLTFSNLQPNYNKNGVFYIVIGRVHCLL